MAASEGAPPGYSVTRESDIRSRALFGALLASALVALAHEVLVRQSAAYLSPGFGPPLALTTLYAGVAALAGAVFARRARWAAPALTRLLLLLSALCTASALLWFFAFGERSLFPGVAFAVPLAVAGLLGATIVAALGSLAARVLEGGIVSYWLAPFRLFGLALGLALLAGLFTVVGLLRSVAALGAVLAALALWSREHYLRAGRPASLRSLIFAYAALGLATAAFAGAELLVPVRELRSHPAEIVHTLGGTRQRHVVVSVQSVFELFSNHQLRASSLDGHRYAECLTHPALALGPKRRSVLLLGAADGLIEREVLRYSDVAELTVVAIDGAPRRLALRAIWSPGSVPSETEILSRRVSLVEAEPIVWLEKTTKKFDVVLVDLPDPIDYREGKNFTLHFYRLLAEHLEPGGSIALQITSPLSSPQALSSIVATLEQAAFAPFVYSAPISSLGVWGFARARLASEPTSDRALDAEAQRVLTTLRFLDAKRVSQLLGAPDERVARDAPFNTLPQQPVVELLHEERARLGL